MKIIIDSNDNDSFVWGNSNLKNERILRKILTLISKSNITIFYFLIITYLSLYDCVYVIQSLSSTSSTYMIFKILNNIFLYFVNVQMMMIICNRYVYMLVRLVLKK